MILIRADHTNTTDAQLSVARSIQRDWVLGGYRAMNSQPVVDETTGFIVLQFHHGFRPISIPSVTVEVNRQGLQRRYQRGDGWSVWADWPLR